MFQCSPSPGNNEMQSGWSVQQRRWCRQLWDRIRDDQCKLQGLGDSGKFPWMRWQDPSQASKDTEVLSPARKRELHKQIPALLCLLLSILCDGHFYTHLFYSANRRQAVLVLFSVWKLGLRQPATPEMPPWAFQKHEGSLVTSNWQRPNC